MWEFLYGMRFVLHLKMERAQQQTKYALRFAFVCMMCEQMELDANFFNSWLFSN
jgi:hypothetical protein